MIATILGAVIGLSGLGVYLPAFINQSLDTLKVCMGPGAMLVAGFTIANYPFKKMLAKPKVYAVSLLRLTLIPAAVIGVVFAIKELANFVLGLEINNNVLYLLFFAVATPLGLNTVVFPEAYGGDAEIGAGMTMISHIMCVPLMPLMYALMTLIFGPAAF
jgi:predicted permease